MEHRNTAPAEAAQDFINGYRTEESKRRIASWGAGYILLAAVVIPLLTAFVLPLFAR